MIRGETLILQKHFRINNTIRSDRFHESEVQILDGHVIDGLIIYAVVVSLPGEPEEQLEIYVISFNTSYRKSLDGLHIVEKIPEKRGTVRIIRIDLRFRVSHRNSFNIIHGYK